MLKGHLICLVGDFDSRVIYFLPLGEILAWYFSEKSWPSKWMWWRSQGEKGENLWGLNKRELGAETETCWGLGETLTIWAVFIPWCLQDLLSRSGVEHQECSSGVSKTKRLILSLESGFSEQSWLRGRTGKRRVPVGPWSPVTGD